MSITSKKDTPHYAGHRQRLRARVLENGTQALQDYELLELLLFMAIPRRDVKPLAKTLLTHFGSLPALMNASHEALIRIEGISENTAIALKTVTALAHRSTKMELMQKPVLQSWDRLMEYCQTTMAHETREHFRILFMNIKNELIADEVQHSGTVDETAAYPREIMKRALEVGATALILVHNHPSGDHTPSQSDADLTMNIIRAGQPFNITIHDHIVVSRTGYSSFKNMGLI